MSSGIVKKNGLSPAGNSGEGQLKNLNLTIKMRIKVGFLERGVELFPDFQ